MGLFKEVKKPVIRSVAAASEISPLRPRFVPKAPPCASGCPNGNEIRELLVIIAQAKDYGLTHEQALERAWKRTVERNPFPAITGRVCSHPCEAACNRSSKDGAVAFNAIERTIGDFGIATRLKLSRATDESRREKIAVIGAGPAGLSCAHQLVRRGYAVTVFEGLGEPGGMLRYGIPEFRLPRAVLNAEIRRILDLGVELKCNCAVGRDISLEQLREEYAAVFVGIGAHQGVKLGLPGEDAPNVHSGISFLNRVNRGEKIDLGGKVVVVGAGGTAVDVARVCKRSGAEVTMMGLELMATKAEIDLALAEGIVLDVPVMPAEIQRQNGRATGIHCIRVKPGTTNSGGTPYPTPISGSEFDLEADNIIVAVRQEPDFRGLEDLLNDDDWIKIDDWGKTAMDGMYAGGDCAGLGFVTLAIAQGRLAGEAIDARFQGHKLEKLPALSPIPTEKVKLDWYPAAPRHETQRVPVTERELTTEVERELTEDEVLAEAKRCMSCGMCMDCETCWMYCSNNCFVRLPKGEHCKIKLELCNGCKKCAEACPSGYIELS
jgi:NADPH-dependent glutamate synthase beta subunit-like oxidoreductase/Pyruvate/2-oxoacid:ferredoxin oxidoreductase delta subunit